MVVSKEVAKSEIDKFLDLMNIPTENRDKDTVKVYINILTKAICDGHLVFNEDETITQILKFPLGDGATKEINYDFRYEIGEYQSKTKGTNAFDDEVEYACARLSLISKPSLPVSVFKKLKREDYLIASKLTVFF